jgi:hypothetical protein
MGLTFSPGELELLTGFKAVRGVFGRRLTVLSDADPTNVGFIMDAVTTPAIETDVTTQFNFDPRFTIWADVPQAEDPELEHGAIVTDTQFKWKVVRKEDNQAQSTVRYWMVQIDKVDL